MADLDVMARLWAHVLVGGDDDCWEWQRGGIKYGYGHMRVGDTAKLTHRLVMEEHVGRVLGADECVLHRCDNPPCCNPRHLFIGTRQDNFADMLAKGRARVGVVGEQHGKAKLTWAAVNDMRSSADSARVLAERYGVTPGTVRRIWKGERWAT